MFLPFAGFAQTASPKQRTVWDGVFTKAQVERGVTAYNSNCSRCHGEDLGRLGGVLTGAKFMDRWREDSLSSLFKVIRDTMPPGPRGSMTEAEYVDVVAYVLSMNAFPAGTTDLARTELERILLVGKEGPQPVPDFSLVTVVGCLARDGEKGWMVTDASEPWRTRNPRESTPSEMLRATTHAGGYHTFHFLDTYEFQDEFKAGRWMEAKGFLIRSPGNDRINLTWLNGLREACGSH